VSQSLRGKLFADSKASKAFRREAMLIRKNLSKLVQDIDLIEQNKFVETLKEKIPEVDPTEELFGDEVTQANNHETGVHTISWGPQRKNINFINPKPTLVPTESRKKE